MFSCSVFKPQKKLKLQISKGKKDKYMQYVKKLEENVNLEGMLEIGNQEKEKGWLIRVNFWRLNAVLELFHLCPSNMFMYVHKK